MIQSPLNYTGGKYKLLPQIQPLFPQQIGTFVDLFCGGCSVGINTKADNHIYMDHNEALIHLFSVMQRVPVDEFILRMEDVISGYNLSEVRINGYEYYNCNSSDGLSSFNRPGYLNLRNDVNSTAIHDDNYYIRLYVLILYAFNNQIRFNRQGKFNLPPGKRDFNQKMYDKLIAFISALQKQNAVFVRDDFRNLDIQKLTEHDFVYADPPYLITCASYNEQGGWTMTNETDLLELLDNLHDHHIRFALSNVLEAKGRTNEILRDWIQARPEYRMIDLNYTYKNANYQRQNRDTVTREILVVNY
jgi:DNA adenine methylase Dam